MLTRTDRCIVRCCGTLLLVTLVTAAAVAEEIRPLDNRPPRGVAFDGLVSAASLASLSGQPMVLKLKSGLLVRDAELQSMQFDRRGHGLRILKYKLATGRSVPVKAADIYGMRIGGQRYHLRYYRPGQQLFLINGREANRVAASRLDAANHSIRQLLDEDQQREATTEHKLFLEKAVKTLVDDGLFRIEESDSTLILTDFPRGATAPLRKYVDALNQRLNQMFGIPRGDSIWRGKPILAVFTSKASFAAFEEKVMNYRNHGGRAGVRSTEKMFLQTSVPGRLDASAARSVCWGYSLGFAKRLHSDAPGVPWIGAGISNIVPNAIVGTPKERKRQRERIREKLRRDRSLLGLLEATRLEPDRWPMCGELVHFLYAEDPIAFGQLYRDTKLGVELATALKQNFGVTLQQLAQAFGMSLDVPNVTP